MFWLFVGQFLQKPLAVLLDVKVPAVVSGELRRLHLALLELVRKSTCPGVDFPDLHVRAVVGLAFGQVRLELLVVLYHVLGDGLQLLDGDVLCQVGVLLGCGFRCGFRFVVV